MKSLTKERKRLGVSELLFPNSIILHSKYDWEKKHSIRTFSLRLSTAIKVPFIAVDSLREKKHSIRTFSLRLSTAIKGTFFPHHSTVG